jgi:hypothetical protein
MGRYSKGTVIQVAPKGGGPFVEHVVSSDNGNAVLTTAGELIVKNAVLMQEKK